MNIALFKKNQINKKHHNIKRGFTLLEMLVSLGIITAITGIIFWNQSQFNNDLEITNLAYRVALAVREAQVAGTSVKQSSAGGFDTAYGVHFSKVSSSEYIYFVDSNKNGQYDDPDNNNCNLSSGDECITKTVIGRGNTIGSNYKITSEDGSFNNANPADGFDVTFFRPNPDAIINTFNSNGVYTPLPGIGIAVCLISPLQRYKLLSVFKTGQITISDPAQNGAGVSCP